MESKTTEAGSVPAALPSDSHHAKAADDMDGESAGGLDAAPPRGKSGRRSGCCSSKRHRER